MVEGSVLWFRHGLRLHDNPALHYALANKAVPFYPIFIFDGESAGTRLVGYNRMKFLLEALSDIDNQLKKYGGRLLLFQGKADDVIRKLWEEFGITKLSFELDSEPVSVPRDNSVKFLCKEIGVHCTEHVSHTLWNPSTVIEANGGIPPLTYQIFLHVVDTIGLPPRPVGDVDFSGVKFGYIPPNLYKIFGYLENVPKPEDLGVYPEALVGELPMIRWHGGETTALQLFEKRLKVEGDTFMKGSYLPNHSNPDLLGPPTSLSPALRFGCLSIRRFYWAIHDMFSEIHGDFLPSTPFITGQLIWREYFYTMSVNNPAYGEMWNNPICLNIPWNKPDPDLLNKWKKGCTGFPFIDAAMRQLHLEGWIHHCVRNAVASFLTRGTLWISWECGLEHFLKYLLDADWSVCAGNWMWVSSSAFERLLDSSACVCPVQLGRRLNPSGEYVYRYVPELRNMPVKYIYEPWKAPIEVQEKAGCIIGKDYPNRVVDHIVAMQKNQAAMEALCTSYQNNPPHCCPSNEEEARRLMWLPDDMAYMPE